jgi:hypothetical protein
MDDVEPYEITRAVDSDDDRPVGELTESDIEAIRHIYLCLPYHISSSSHQTSTAHPCLLGDPTHSEC